MRYWCRLNVSLQAFIRLYTFGVHSASASDPSDAARRRRTAHAARSPALVATDFTAGQSLRRSSLVLDFRHEFSEYRTVAFHDHDHGARRRPLSGPLGLAPYAFASLAAERRCVTTCLECLSVVQSAFAAKGSRRTRPRPPVLSSPHQTLNCAWGGGAVRRVGLGTCSGPCACGEACQVMLPRSLRRW